MRTVFPILFVTVAVLAAAPIASAAETRSYDRSLELVWDDAVKAARDAELVLTDSDRADHWFTMETPPKTFSSSVGFEVTLERVGDETEVTVRALDRPDSKKSQRAMAAFFEALERRLR